MNYWQRKQLLPFGALAEIATELNVSIQLVSAVNRGRRSNELVRRAIAAKIGLSVERVFPERQEQVA